MHQEETPRNASDRSRVREQLARQITRQRSNFMKDYMSKTYLTETEQMRVKHKPEKELDIYHELQKHLALLPISPQSSDSVVEIDRLKYVFTPAEAKVATYLNLIPEPLRHIHVRTQKSGIPIEKLESVLDCMAQKGSIKLFRKRDEKYYCANEFAF